MKAVIVVSHGKVEVRDIPAPKPAPNEALVKIEACGLCGTTDRHLVEGHLPHHPASDYPAILGHEAVGTVIEVGAAVTRFKRGDRVTRPAAILPGSKRDGLFSAWGGFAEFGLVHEETGDYTGARQRIVPPGIAIEDAVLAVSLAEVASWMEKLGDLTGKTIVIGGTGFAACVMCQCAAEKGARHIIVAGRSPHKFEWARHNGATDAILLHDKPEQALKKIAGENADWFLDAAGHQAVFEKGLSLLKVGGAAAIYGAPDDFSYHLPLGSVGGDFSVHYLAPADDKFLQETFRRISSGRLRPDLLRTHVWYGLDSIHQALADQADGKVLKGFVKI